MTALLALALLVGGQFRVDNPGPLTEDQQAVLPLLERIENAILEDNKVGFIAMFDSSSREHTLQQISDINAFSARIANPSDLLSCSIFDTACARSQLKIEVFVSVKEFLQKHRNEMQVTFQEQPAGFVQAELHIPRRPDAATVPPPAGLYESLTLGFVKSAAGWKINLLFPEVYSIVLGR